MVPPLARRWPTPPAILDGLHAVAEAIYRSQPRQRSLRPAGRDPGLFVLSLPGWLLLAKIYGLYGRDEERADHSTADEVFSVFNMLAVGTLGFYAFTFLFPGLTAIPLAKILTFLALLLRSRLVVLAPRGRAWDLPTHRRLHARTR